MTIHQFEQYARDITRRAKDGNDACLLVYFSREDDRYVGMDEGLDSGDALIVIRELVTNYGLDPQVVAELLRARAEEVTP